MYLFNRMRELYETSKPGSTEYILSQFILLNVTKLDAISLSDISKATSISKAAVSKFINSISSKKGFAQFKSSLLLEMQYSHTDQQSLYLNAKQFKDSCFITRDGNTVKFNQYEDDKNIQIFSRALKKSKKIVFFGNDSKKSYFSQLMNSLLLEGKDVKYCSWIYSDIQNDEINHLDESSLLVFVDPSISLYDFHQRLPMSVEMCFDIDKIKANKYFIGKPSKVFEENSVGIQETGNRFVDDMVLVYFIALTFHYYFSDLKQ